MHWTDIHTRHRGAVRVIELRGHLTLGDDDRRLMPEVSRWLDAGHREFLLNLEHLSYVDSMGIGEMVGVYTRVRKLGGNVKLCHVSPRVQEILIATRLDDVLESLGSEDEAVARMTQR